MLQPESRPSGSRKPTWQFQRIVGRNWYAALLVASCAERAQGRRTDLAGNPRSGKLALTEFAELADCDRGTLAKYLDAWECAAADGLVPPAATLEPGAGVDLSQLDARAWEHYSSAADVAEIDWAKEALRSLRGTRRSAPDWINGEYGGAHLGALGRAKIQLDHYVELMGHGPPPAHRQGSVAWRQFEYAASGNLPPPAGVANRWAEVAGEALRLLLDDVEGLSDWHDFVAGLRRCASMIEDARACLAPALESEPSR